MSSPVVQLRGLCVGYPGRVIVNLATFSIARGELVALLGPNGAGKTTLLKTLVGLLPPLSGSFEIGTQDDRRVVGYVPQHDRLDAIFPLTALEVVLMGTYVGRGLFFRTTAADRRLARDCLRQVGLGLIEGERFSQLSGGQKQRVLIARALAANPEVLLLDEPTAGVDPGAEAATMRLIQELSADFKLTVVLVSHHLALVRSCVDSVVWVSGGEAVKGEASALLTSERIESIFGEVTPFNG